VAQSLPRLVRHFWAAIYLARLLAEEPTRGPDALRSAVAEAVQSHDARPRLQDLSGVPYRQLRDEFRNRRKPRDVRHDEQGFSRKRVTPRNDGVMTDGRQPEMVQAVPFRFARAKSFFGPNPISSRGSTPTQSDDSPEGNRLPSTRDAFPKSGDRSRHIEKLAPSKSPMRLDQQRLGHHVSEPVLLPPIHRKAPIGRSKYGEGIPRCRSEVTLAGAGSAGNHGYPNDCLKLPKLASPAPAPGVSGISKLHGRGNIVKRAAGYEDPPTRQHGHWRP